MTYVINNYGAPTSLTNLVDHLRNVEKIAVERRTVSAYSQMLVDAKILCRCQRFDLKSRKSLKGGSTTLPIPVSTSLETSMCA